MLNTYLIAFSNRVKIDEMSKFMETLPKNKFWFYNMANSIFVNSEANAQEISNKIREKYGDLAHIVVKVTDNDRAGQILKDHLQHIIYRSSS